MSKEQEDPRRERVRHAEKVRGQVLQDHPQAALDSAGAAAWQVSTAELVAPDVLCPDRAFAAQDLSTVRPEKWARDLLSPRGPRRPPPGRSGRSAACSDLTWWPRRQTGVRDRGRRGSAELKGQQRREAARSRPSTASVQVGPDHSSRRRRSRRSRPRATSEKRPLL